MMTFTRLPLFACLLLLPLAGLAAPPENDFWRSPTPLPGQALAISGDNSDATDSPEERAYHGVWFQWSPEESGPYEFTTNGSSIDTVLSVQRINPGFSGGLQELKYNDNRDESTTDSAVRLKSFATVDYRILVASANEGESGSFNLQITRLSPPPNDDASGATLLTGNSPVIVDENTPATSTADEDGENGLWYQWVATENATYRVTTAGSRFFTRLTIFTGNSPANLTEIAFSDDAPGGGSLASSIDIPVTQSTRYWFLVSSSIPTESGRLQLSLAVPPANDTPEGAIPLPQSSPSASGSNRGAVSEVGGFNSIWYRWSPDQDAAYSVSTAGSEINTILTIYKGPSPEDLTRIGSNDDDRPRDTLTSRMDLNMLAAETYWFIVGASNEGDFGDIRIQVDPLPAPGNDSVETPTVLTGERILQRDSITGASSDANENGYYGVWYRWAAPVSASYLISTARSAFDTFLTVYSGDSPATLSQLAFNDDSPENPDGNFRGVSSLVLTVNAGTEYWILVSAASNSESGQFSLNMDPVPSNDTPAGARLLTGLDPVTTDDNTGALGGPEERGVHSVWYKWTAPMSREYAITTAGSSFDTILTVFRGTSPGNLEEVGFNDDGSAEPNLFIRTSYLPIMGEADTTYYIQVSAKFEGQTGSITLAVIPGVFPQTLEEWLQTELTDFGITTNNGPMDDHDQDGLIHLVEYAFGLNPRGPDDPGFIRPAFSNIFESMTVSYDRRKASTAPGLVYIAEFSGNFIDWSGEGLDPSIRSVNSVWERVTIRQPENVSGRSTGARVLIFLEP